MVQSQFWYKLTKHSVNLQYMFVYDLFNKSNNTFTFYTFPEPKKIKQQNSQKGRKTRSKTLLIKQSQKQKVQEMP